MRVVPVLAELKAATAAQHQAQAGNMSCCASMESAAVTHETANVCCRGLGMVYACVDEACQILAVTHCPANYIHFCLLGTYWVNALHRL
jgi:hypothetical protein